MAKKSLSEQIFELADSKAKDYDIEDAERGVFDHSEHEEDESGAELDDDKLKSLHYVTVSKSKLRENGIELRDQKYEGKASTRKEIFEDIESGSEEEEDDEGELDESEQDEELSETGDEQTDGQSKEDSEESIVDSEEEGSESEDEDSEPFTESDEEASGSLKRDKLKQLMSQERKVILSRLSTSTQIDAIKGYAVVSQQKKFDQIIDARIKLQKALQSANALPLNNEAFEEFVEDDSESLQEKAIESVYGLLDSILSLRANIYSKEKITKEPIKFTSKKRTLSEYVSESGKLDALLKKNSGQVLTKWSHKVQSASGAQALNASKFKTLNQNAAQQVDANLMDMDRLVKRTRLNRRSIVPLGRFEDDGEEKKMDGSLKEDTDVFDDEDFYRVLLNDLVNKKLSESAPAGGLVITKTKVKKNVDTKASKGRKLKYTVQEPIQNYEAPRGRFKWDDEQIDEFFAGLLGQRVDFAESESDEESDDEEKELLKEDELKLFG